jgi:hypothetical protein
MELLIPGLALVALMIYASTRIKRSAARAFEREEISGDGFSFTKPDGFLHRIDDKSEYAFEAYSKDFGTGDADGVRAATAVVLISNTDLKEAAAAERTRLTNPDSTDPFELGEAHCVLMTGEVVKDGHPFDVSLKIMEKDGRTRTLRIEVLKEPPADFSRKIDEMIVSFGPN